MKFLTLLTVLLSFNLKAFDNPYKIKYDTLEEKLIIESNKLLFIEMTDNDHKILLNCNKEITTIVCPLSLNLFESNKTYILHDMSIIRNFSKDDISF